MKLTYENIYAILNSKFDLVKGEKKNYFLDDSKRIAATVDEDLITMFYSFPKHSDEIWNHFGKVAVAFAKDFNVNEQICDAICIDGLIGATNDFIIEKDFFISTTYNIARIPGAKFTGTNTDGIQLFDGSENYVLGNCGCLSSHNGIASFDICGVMSVNNMVVNKKWDGYDINVIDVKGTKKVDYEEVYNFYRQKNDWHYNAGYNTTGSCEIRAFTERRKYSTVDSDSIHMNYILKSRLDAIYEKGNQSINAKRLQMISILKSLLKDKKQAADYVSTYYNFNIRNCDLNRKRVKR